MEFKNIKSFEDACKVNNEDPTCLPDVSMLSKEDGEFLINIFKLTKIVKAINGTWVPDYGNHDQRKYFLWFEIEEDYVPGSGGGFSFCGCADAFSTVGARLVFETREQAEYAAEQFLDLYKKVHLIIK
ncbi:MAG: hypothetical protein WC756_03580 [Taibaiella sp.]|jgi:hypothetical protein